MTRTTILTARRLHTVDPAVAGDAVAVSDGRIAAVGSVDDLRAAHPAAVVDDRYADAVILPGFVEAHAHSMAGGIWAFTYVGYFDNRDPRRTALDRLQITRGRSRPASGGRSGARGPCGAAPGMGARSDLLPG